mmetsp:Transcript_53486/g.95967  ORF Transcript_53486/g.95967 Transcript_53486/m.95967 type:complete len:269 (-) Transcript_53486:3-809(-)
MLQTVRTMVIRVIIALLHYLTELIIAQSISSVELEALSNFVHVLRGMACCEEDMLERVKEISTRNVAIVTAVQCAESQTKIGVIPIDFLQDGVNHLIYVTGLHGIPLQLLGFLLSRLWRLLVPAVVVLLRAVVLRPAISLPRLHDRLPRCHADNGWNRSPTLHGHRLEVGLLRLLLMINWEICLLSCCHCWLRLVAQQAKIHDPLIHHLSIIIHDGYGDSGACSSRWLAKNSAHPAIRNNSVTFVEAPSKIVHLGTPWNLEFRNLLPS